MRLTPIPMVQTKPLQAAALLMLGCGGAIALASPAAVSQSQVASPQAVSIQFRAMVGDRPFACGLSYAGLGTTDSTLTPADFRLYVSEVGLVDAEGTVTPLQLDQDGKWQYQNVALLDFEDGSGACANGTPETRTQVTGSIPAGDYTGITFTLGVPFSLNHNDVTLAPSPLNLTSMWWNWQGGYKFVRIDLEHQRIGTGDAERQSGVNSGHHAGAQRQHGDTGSHHGNHGEHGGHSMTQGFLIHLGSTGCQIEGDRQQPTICNHPNRSTVVFSDFDPADNEVVADLAALVAESDLTTNAAHTPLGCMSALGDRDCTAILNNFGLAYGGQPSQGQTFFRME